MITLYGFGRVFRQVIGETRDLRAQWALRNPRAVGTETITAALAPTQLAGRCSHSAKRELTLNFRTSNRSKLLGKPK